MFSSETSVVGRNTAGNEYRGCLQTLLRSFLQYESSVLLLVLVSSPAKHRPTQVDTSGFVLYGLNTPPTHVLLGLLRTLGPMVYRMSS